MGCHVLRFLFWVTLYEFRGGAYGWILVLVMGFEAVLFPFTFLLLYAFLLYSFPGRCKHSFLSLMTISLITILSSLPTVSLSAIPSFPSQHANHITTPLFVPECSRRLLAFHKLYSSNNMRHIGDTPVMQ